MEVFYDILKEINIAQLFAIGTMFWFFYTRSDGKIDKLEQKMELRFDKHDRKFEKIETQLNDIDKRIFAIETMMHMKDWNIALEERSNVKKVI